MAADCYYKCKLFLRNDNGGRLADIDEYRAKDYKTIIKSIVDLIYDKHSTDRYLTWSFDEIISNFEDRLNNADPDEEGLDIYAEFDGNAKMTEDFRGHDIMEYLNKNNAVLNFKYWSQDNGVKGYIDVEPDFYDTDEMPWDGEFMDEDF